MSPVVIESGLSPFHVSLFDWWLHHRRTFSWRSPDVTAWEVLVSEMLLWQTKADVVETVWEPFWSRFPSPSALATAAPSAISEITTKLGLEERSEYLRSSAVRIISEYGGEVPEERERLISLMGIGGSSASAVRAFYFLRDEAIVDHNVTKIISRMFALDKGDQSAVKAVAERMLPLGWAREWGYALLDLGALVCKYRPACSKCPMQGMCATGIGKKRQEKG